MDGKESMASCTDTIIKSGSSNETLSAEQAIALSRTSSLKLECTKNGGILKTFTNACEIVQRDNYLSGKMRLNALDDRPYMYGFFWNTEPHSIKDVDLYQLRKYIANIYGLNNKDDIKQAVQIAAAENAFHPITELLNGLVWDGKNRISALLPKYLGAECSEYTTAVTTMLLHGAIQRVFNPGCKFDYCVILADTKQGTGKSSLCRMLAIKDEWFCDALGDMSDTKRAYETIRGHWICELGEMIATRRTKDIEAIKAYLSRQGDDYREPYGIYTERRPRQCVFIGTSNKPQFLPDDKTGNRRFIPVICNGDQAIKHPLKDEAETRFFILQCYAEALEIGKAEGWMLQLDEKYTQQLDAIRNEATPEDAKVGMIQNWLDNTETDIVCSRMIYHEVFDSIKSPEKYELEDISDIMNLKIEGWEKYKGIKGNATSMQFRFKEYGRQRAWIRIVNSSVNGSVNNDGFHIPNKAECEKIPFNLSTGV